MTQEKKKEELIGLFAVGAITAGEIIDECFSFANAHPNWISVNDAFPEDNEVVIAFDDRQGTLFTNRQTIIERNLYTKSNKITYWMRIPAPPKAE